MTKRSPTVTFALVLANPMDIVPMALAPVLPEFIGE
jgi:hypothetical protein